MQRPIDELLVGYLDGELDDQQQAEVERWLDQDPTARDHLARLSESTAVLRTAFDEILREEVPERLIKAARGVQPVSAPRQAEIIPFRAPRIAGGLSAYRNWWVGVPVAASILGLVIGGGLGYVGANKPAGDGTGAETLASNINTSTGNWLDNIAEYHKLFVSANSGQNSFADIPAADDGGQVIQKISQRTEQPNVRVPDLKPWGLVFQGARLAVVEGRSAAQLVYTADDQSVGKAIGPLTVMIGLSKRPDLAPTFEHREDVNMLYWRRNGHFYAIVGAADSGYMWGLANDIAWQLDAI